MPVFEITSNERTALGYSVIYFEDGKQYKLDFTSDKELSYEEILKRIENA